MYGIKTHFQMVYPHGYPLARGRNKMFQVNERIYDIKLGIMSIIKSVTYDAKHAAYRIILKNIGPSSFKQITIKELDLLDENSPFYINFLHLSKVTGQDVAMSKQIDTVLYQQSSKTLFLFKQHMIHAQSLRLIEEKTNLEITVALNHIDNTDDFFIAINRRGEATTLLPGTNTIYDVVNDATYYSNLYRNNQTTIAPARSLNAGTPTAPPRPLGATGGPANPHLTDDELDKLWEEFHPQNNSTNDEKNTKCPKCGSKNLGFGPGLCNQCKDCGHTW